MRLSPLPSVSLEHPCCPGSSVHGTTRHLDGSFQPPPYPLLHPLSTLSFLGMEVFLAELGVLTLVFSSLSPSLSLEHCKPIFEKKVLLIPGWAHWWKETDLKHLAWRPNGGGWASGSEEGNTEVRLGGTLPG